MVQIVLDSIERTYAILDLVIVVDKLTQRKATLQLISSDERDIGAVTRMDSLKRAKIKRGAQRAQATKIWNEAGLLTNGEMNEVNIKKLRVILATYDAKIELLRKLDETACIRSNRRRKGFRDGDR